MYGSNDTGTSVVLNIEFNKEGKKKFEEVTKKYIQSTNEEGNSVTKQIKLELDGESLIETYFSETITTGILQLTIGSSSNTNTQDLNTYMNQATNIASLIDSGKMPLEYELQDNTYLKATITKDMQIVVFLIVLSVIVIGCIYWIIKYKKNGIFASIGYIGLIAFVLLAIRYTNVIISIESIISAIILLVTNYIIMTHAIKQFEKNDISKKEIIKTTYKHYTSSLAILLIIAIVFTFTNWLPIASMGMVLFWGLFVLIIYNYVIMNVLLEVKKEKQ